MVSFVVYFKVLPVFKVLPGVLEKVKYENKCTENIFLLVFFALSLCDFFGEVKLLHVWVGLEMFLFQHRNENWIHVNALFACTLFLFQVFEMDFHLINFSDRLYRQSMKTLNVVRHHFNDRVSGQAWSLIF
jgi:uncharacterized membrane protein